MPKVRDGVIALKDIVIEEYPSESERLAAIPIAYMPLIYEPLRSPLAINDFIRLSSAKSPEDFWALREEIINGIKWLIALDPLTVEPIAVHPRIGEQVYRQRTGLPIGRRIQGHLYFYGEIARELFLIDRAQENQLNAGTGYIYFIQGEAGGPIKIGFSLEPEARKKELQVTSPTLLVIVGLLTDGSLRKEHELHQRFSATRLHGEWFEPTSDLMDFIRENCDAGCS